MATARHMRRMPLPLPLPSRSSTSQAMAQVHTLHTVSLLRLQTATQKAGRAPTKAEKLFFSSFFLHVHRLFTVHIAISGWPLPSPFRWVQKILLALGSAERDFLPPFRWGGWQMATEKPNSNPIAAGKHKSSGSKRG
jgi:hypothetical protein